MAPCMQWNNRCRERRETKEDIWQYQRGSMVRQGKRNEYWNSDWIKKRSWIETGRNPEKSWSPSRHPERVYHIEPSDQKRMRRKLCEETNKSALPIRPSKTIINKTYLSSKPKPASAHPLAVPPPHQPTPTKQPPITSLAPPHVSPDSTSLALSSAYSHSQSQSQSQSPPQILWATVVLSPGLGRVTLTTTGPPHPERATLCAVEPVALEDPLVYPCFHHRLRCHYRWSSSTSEEGQGGWKKKTGVDRGRMVRMICWWRRFCGGKDEGSERMVEGHRGML